MRNCWNDARLLHSTKPFPKKESSLRKKSEAIGIGIFKLSSGLKNTLVQKLQNYWSVSSITEQRAMMSASAEA